MLANVLFLLLKLLIFVSVCLLIFSDGKMQKKKEKRESYCGTSTGEREKDNNIYILATKTVFTDNIGITCVVKSSSL